MIYSFIDTIASLALAPVTLSLTHIHHWMSHAWLLLVDTILPVMEHSRTFNQAGKSEGGYLPRLIGILYLFSFVDLIHKVTVTG